jgi:predicted metalloprotease with PDZ domain
MRIVAKPWKRILNQLILCLLLLESTHLTYAQELPFVSCVTCRDLSSDNNKGWTESPTGCGPTCNDPHPECQKNCIPVVPSRTNTALTPGLFVEQRATKLWVKSVVPGSPAHKAGLLANDEILAINGKGPGRQCSTNGWGSATASDDVSLTIRRDGAERTIMTELVPMESLLSYLWEPITLAPMALESYMLGIKWKFTTDGLVVSNVLHGGSGEAAGIRIGDTIVAVDSSPARRMAESLVARDHRFSTDLTVERNGVTRHLKLRAGTFFEAVNSLQTDEGSERFRAATNVADIHE